MPFSRRAGRERWESLQKKIPLRELGGRKALFLFFDRLADAPRDPRQNLRAIVITIADTPPNIGELFDLFQQIAHRNHVAFFAGGLTLIEL